MSNRAGAAAVVLSLCLSTAGCGVSSTQVLPSRPLPPLVVAHTSDGYDLISVCGVSIASASVEQPAEFGQAVTYQWTAQAAGVPKLSVALLADSVDGYRVRVNGTRDENAEAVVSFLADDEIGGRLVVDLGKLALGQVATANSIISRAEYDRLPKTVFGCRG